MIDDLPSYDAYRDSGAGWIGQVPEHWDVMPNRALFSEVKEVGHADEPLLSVTISKGVIEQSQLLSESSKKDSSNADKSKYKLVEPGDVAYNKMRAWQGAIGTSRFRGIVSPAYVVQRPRARVLADYVHHLFRTPAFATEAERWSYGITSDQWSLRPEHFKMIYACCPPLAEQAAITKFLGAFDRRVGRATRAKGALLSLISEQRQAIVQEAITSGTRPSEAVKSSGVAWLPDVPAHWDVTRLGRLIDLKTGFPFKSEGFTSDENDIRLLRGINVTPRAARWDSVVRWPTAERESFQDYELREGDIVFGMDRPIVRAGVRAAKLTSADVPSLLLQRVARLRPHQELLVDYLLLLLASKSFADYLQPIFTGISVPHVSPEQIKSFVIPLPPLKEQEEIVADVRQRLERVEALARVTESELRLLREFRVAVEAEVVLGRVDVRAAADALADEAEETSDLDGGNFDIDADVEDEVAA